MTVLHEQSLAEMSVDAVILNAATAHGLELEPQRLRQPEASR